MISRPSIRLLLCFYPPLPSVAHQEHYQKNFLETIFVDIDVVLRARKERVDSDVVLPSWVLLR